jgi:hypothetical protein
MKLQIESNVRDITQLVNTGVFSADVVKVFREPVFVLIILKLNDLLQKFDKLGYRIIFKEDISISGIDITELVRRMRNAITHLDSNENMLDEKSKIKFVFNIMIGKIPNAVVIDGKSYGTDYEDDIAFFYGEYCLYFKRHIIRIIQESEIIYKKLYDKKLRF